VSTIDYKFIEETRKFEKENNVHILKKLLTIYLGNAQTSMDKILAHFNELNFEELKKESHKFKSSSGNLGAFEIHRVCQLIENEITTKKNPSVEELADLISELQVKFKPTIEELTMIMRSVEN
jgi:HPt (histidine-containing phosphotransfer) domain-containing protein